MCYHELFHQELKIRQFKPSLDFFQKKFHSKKDLLFYHLYVVSKSFIQSPLKGVSVAQLILFTRCYSM